MSGNGRRAASQNNVFHFHIHNASTNEEQNIIQGDFVQNKTDIRRSNIGSLKLPSQERETEDFESMNSPSKLTSSTVSDAVTSASSIRYTQADEPENTSHDTSQTTATNMNISQPTSDSGETSRPRASNCPTNEGNGNQENSHKQSRMRISYLKGKATSCIYNRKFEEARQLLEEIERIERCDDIDTMLMMAECYIHLGRRGAEKRIDMLSDTVSECKSVSADELKSWGHRLKSGNRDVGAILLYRAASDQRSREDVSPNDLVTWIRSRTFDIGYPASNLARNGNKSRAIVVIYVIGILMEMLESLRAVSGVDANHRASMEAGCHAHMVLVCNAAKEYHKSLEFGKHGLHVLKCQLGAEAHKNRSYVDILNKLVVAHENLGQLAEAEECYRKALPSKLKATDVDTGRPK